MNAQATPGHFTGSSVVPAQLFTQMWCDQDQIEKQASAYGHAGTALTRGGGGDSQRKERRNSGNRRASIS